MNVQVNKQHIFMSIRPGEIMNRWERSSLTANFLAEYLGSDFSDRDKAQNVLSSVLNELIENAAKNSIVTAGDIDIEIRNQGTDIHIEIKNLAETKNAIGFADRISQINSLADIEEVLLNTMREEKEGESSGLGLLLLKQSFEAHIETKLDPTENQNITGISTRVTIPISGL